MSIYSLFIDLRRFYTKKCSITIYTYILQLCYKYIFKDIYGSSSIKWHVRLQLQVTVKGSLDSAASAPLVSRHGTCWKRCRTWPGKKTARMHWIKDLSTTFLLCFFLPTIFLLCFFLATTFLLCFFLATCIGWPCYTKRSGHNFPPVFLSCNNFPPVFLTATRIDWRCIFCHKWT